MLGDHVRRKSAARGPALDLDQVAGLEIGPVTDAHRVRGRHDELAEGAVVHDQRLLLHFVEMGDGAANADRIAERAAVLRQRANVLNPREQR